MNLIKQFVEQGYDVILCAEADGYETYFEALGVQILSHKSTRLKIIQCLSFCAYIIVSILKSKPQHVFSFTILNNISAGCARLCHKFNFVPNITGLGRTWSIKVGRVIFRALYRLFFRKASFIVVQNERDEAVFLSIFKSGPRIVKVNGSGVDLDKFKPVDRLFDRKPVRFSMISRLVKDKGYILYLDALSMIKAECGSEIEVDFVAGYGSDKIVLDKLRLAYPTINIFDFKHNIYEYLATVDVSVLPSSYNEGTPRILIESLASGCAVITSDQPGCVETVSEKINGFVLHALTAEELYNTVYRYLNLTLNEKREFSKNSFQLCAQNYDEKMIINKYLYFVNIS